MVTYKKQNSGLSDWKEHHANKAETKYSTVTVLERFSLDCRKTKTKVNTLANQRT